MDDFLKELKELCERHHATIISSPGVDPEGYDSAIIFRVRGVRDYWKFTEGQRFP